MEKKLNTIKKNKKKTKHTTTESRGNEALMLLLSLPHYYAKQKKATRNTPTPLYANTKY